MKLLHLYYDIMNLYGDYANVSAMKRILEKSGEQVTVDRLTLGDSVDFSQYDFVYIPRSSTGMSASRARSRC